MHNKTIIGFGFRTIAIIIKASVCVLRLWQMTQTLALIIIVIMLNLIQYLLNVNQRGSVLVLLFPFSSKEHAHAALNTTHKERNKNKKQKNRRLNEPLKRNVYFLSLFPYFYLFLPTLCFASTRFMPLMIAIIRELPIIETKVEVVYMQILSLLPLCEVMPNTRKYC